MRSKLALIIGLLAAGLPATASDAVSRRDASSARVAELINKLGHEDYAIREAAQHRLKRIGVAAFDALHEAQDSDDVEIRMRARYLVGSTEIAWATENDSREVRSALKDYRSQSVVKRRQRISRVAELDATAALCRIARFEPSEQLSKYAALEVMQRETKDEASAAERADRILQEVQQSRRPAADWLRTFARTGDVRQSVDAWTEVVDSEIKLLTTAPEKTNRNLVQSLAKWHAQRLIDAELREHGVAAMRRVIDVHDDSSRLRLIELSDWLSDHDAWQLVVETAARFDSMFDVEPMLLYRRARAHLKIDQAEQAEQVATRAFELPATRAIRGNSPYDTRVSRGIYLEGQGLIAWCKREYLKAITESNASDYEGYYARIRISEIFHDEGEDNEAANNLQEILKAIKKNSRVRTMVKQLLYRDQDSIEARMHYFRAMHLERVGEADKSRELLAKGLKADPTDPDVLIAMYRSPDAPEEWRTQTVKRIEEAASLIQARIQSLEAVKRDDNKDLANDCNHYAWLVSNTVGDYQEALKQSQRSLELIPGSPELTDTLARCYYANKDYENAVKYQRIAFNELSHSHQIRRQLELFEKAYAESKTADKP